MCSQSSETEADFRLRSTLEMQTAQIFVFMCVLERERVFMFLLKIICFPMVPLNKQQAYAFNKIINARRYVCVRVCVCIMGMVMVMALPPSLLLGV